MKTNSKIFVAGHRGLVGSALCDELKEQGYKNIVTATRKEVNLLFQDEVEKFFRHERPDYVFLAAAKVGGIVAHTLKPVDFLYENLRIQENVINAAFQTGVDKLLFLGSACAYPKYAPCPIREEYLLEGPLEPTNRGYALAKIAGIELCKAFRAQYGCNFISCMPTNLYGPGDNYNLNTSHVLPGMLHRMHNAKKAGSKQVELWGTGKPTREFLYSRDLANACIFLMNNYDSGDLINVGFGESIPLTWVAGLVQEIVGYTGEIFWDHSKPDGTPQRQLDCWKLFGMGWRPRVGLPAGVKLAYDDFLCRNELL